jgi:hypothetical protein
MAVVYDVQGSDHLVSPTDTKRSEKMSKQLERMMFLSIGAAFVVALAGGSARADTAVASYTGCLNPSTATLHNIAIGNVPTKPCGTESIVHLSGGDITGVGAGTGLAGGGTNGGVTLGLATSYQLPQGCSDGQIAVASASAWSCGTDQNTTYSGANFATSGQSCADGEFATAIDAAGALTCATPTTLKSQNGAFTVTVSDNKLVLHGTGGTLTIDNVSAILSGVGWTAITGPQVRLNGACAGVARRGDSVTGITPGNGAELENGQIADGSVSVFAC